MKVLALVDRPLQGTNLIGERPIGSPVRFEQPVGDCALDEAAEIFGQRALRAARGHLATEIPLELRKLALLVPLEKFSDGVYRQVSQVLSQHIFSERAGPLFLAERGPGDLMTTPHNLSSRASGRVRARHDAESALKRRRISCFGSGHVRMHRMQAFAGIQPAGRPLIGKDLPTA
jgi:hypothetical protein